MTGTKALWVAGYVAVVLLPVVVAGALHVHPAAQHVHDHSDRAHYRADAGPLRLAGRLCALAGVSIIVLQFVLAGRIKALAGPFGQDRVIRLHVVAGAAAVGLLIAHPVLIAADSGRWTLLTNIYQPWYLLAGKLALLLMVLQGLTSMLRHRLMDYEKWRLLHNSAVIIIALGLVHAWVMGHSLEHAAMQAIWIAFAVLAGGTWLAHKVVLPLIGFRNAHRVASVQQETHNVWTLALEPPEGVKAPAWAPGQFHYLSLVRNAEHDREEHPFTISSSPTEDRLASSIKESGDFTSTIGRTKPGDRARVDGPYGAFSYVRAPQERDLVLIAGGIGITPFRSMLRHMADSGADMDVLLIYGNRTEADIAFREELDRIASGERPRLRVVHILSEANEGWAGPVGLVNADIIRSHCGEDLSNKVFYVCGPPPMMNSVARTLRSLGVRRRQVRMERFSF